MKRMRNQGYPRTPNGRMQTFKKLSVGEVTGQSECQKVAVYMFT